MSISIVLVPLAVAGVSAWKASRAERLSDGRTACQVQTRMKDQGLLAHALSSTGASVSVSPDRIVTRWEGVDALFARDASGVWQADFTGDIDIDRATSIIEAIDVAYGRLVQQAVLARIRERAPQAGMSISSEKVEDDSSITLVLEVEAR